MHKTTYSYSLLVSFTRVPLFVTQESAFLRRGKPILVVQECCCLYYKSAHSCATRMGTLVERLQMLNVYAKSSAYLGHTTVVVCVIISVSHSKQPIDLFPHHYTIDKRNGDKQAPPRCHSRQHRPRFPLRKQQADGLNIE